MNRIGKKRRKKSRSWKRMGEEKRIVGKKCSHRERMEEAKISRKEKRKVGG